jgi:hypothetical protein
MMKSIALCAQANGAGAVLGVNVEECASTAYKQEQKRKDASMNIHLGLAPLVSLIAGILILVMPRLLNLIVAIYLIVIGLIGLFGAGNFHF